MAGPLSSDDALIALFMALRKDGYRLVPRQLAQARAILADARAAGVAEAELPELLTPLLATTPRQQAELRARLAPAAASRPVRVAPEERVVVAGQPPDIGGRARPVVIGAALLLLAVWLAIYLLRPAAAPAPAPPAATPAATPATAPATRFVERSTVRVDPAYAAWTAILGLAPLALIAGWWLVERRRRQGGLGRATGETALDRLDLGARPIERRLFADPDLALIARQWRRVRRVPTTELDAERTVAATIAAGGLFTPVAARRPLAPDYVLLIEEAGRHDHLARLADNLVDRLADEGVAIRRYYHEDGLTTLRTAEPGRADFVALAEVAARASSTVVLVGSGAALFDPLARRIESTAAAELQRWERRALLSTRAIAAWDDREQALLDAGFALATASEHGVAAFGRHIARDFPAHQALLEGVVVDRAEPAAPPAAVTLLPALVAELDERLKATAANAGAERVAPIRSLLARGAVAEALERIDPPGDPHPLVDAPRLLAAIRARLRRPAAPIADEGSADTPPDEAAAAGAAVTQTAEPDRPPEEFVINRLVLQEFLEGLPSRRPGPRILFVEGPPGSGRSFTLRLVRSRLRDRIPIVTIGPDQPPVPGSELARMVYRGLGWAMPEGAGDHAGLRALAEELVFQANERGVLPLVAVDFAGDLAIDRDTREFLGALVAYDSPFALIVTATFAFTLEGPGIYDAASERLGRFDVRDVAEALQRRLGETIPGDTIQAAAHRIVERSGADARNADIAAATRRVLADLGAPSA